MLRTWKLRSAAFAAATVLGAVAFLVNASAQEKDAAPKPTWLTAGFVRPGAGDPKVASGTVEGQLGGTIYYAVYQLPADKIDSGDPYRTGLADLAKQFVPGTGNGSRSPSSLIPPTNAPRYLYLYEIVNDRGLDQTSKDGIRFASNTDVTSRDIGNMILKLPVEANAIQSWGYFKNAGFAMTAIDRGGAGQERPASLPAKTHMAVSGNPSVLVKIRDLDGQGFTRMAKPVEFKANSGFSVDKAGKNLKNSLFIEELGNRTKLVAWEEEAKKAAETGGDVPDSVELMRFSDNDKNKASTILKASFAANPLKIGHNSVLIGFTSNMAPGNDLVRLQDSETAKKNTGIRTVSTDEIDFGAGGLIALPKEQPKDASTNAASGNQKPSNLIVQGIVTPGDIPSGTKLVDRGSYKTFGGTVYFAVYRKISTSGGDTWGVGRSDFDAQFNPGESYRSTFSPRLDTDAEYLYLYQVVNDRGFHDLKLPENKQTIITPVAMDNAEQRPPITREVASFSLFLRTDPRLITSWGFFDDSGFNVKVQDFAEIRQMANDPAAKPAGMNMAVSSNLSILDTLYPEKDKVYRSWVPPLTVDFNRTTWGVGKDTLNIAGNRIRPVANDRAGGLRFVANKTLDQVKTEGSVRPDYTQIIYFDGSNPVNGATIDGITLGPAEVARAIFKVEWLSKTITEGQQSVIFGFTSNVEPVRSPVRLKDLNTTINDSSEAQERVFLSPSQIQSLALNAVRANAPGIVPVAAGSAAGVVPGVGVTPAPGVAVGNAAAIAPGTGVAAGVGTAPATGVAPGSAAGIALAGLSTDADGAALAVANGLGTGIIPAGLGVLARGSVGSGIAISPSVATPNVGSVGEAAGGGGASVMGFPSVAGTSGSTPSGGGVASGGIGGGVGALGSARTPFFAGGGGSGGGSGSGSGSNQGSSGSNTDGQGNGSGSGSGSGTSGSGVTNNINFNVSQANQQTQSQYQYQNQSQNQNQNQNGGGCCHGGGNVVPAPASLLLGLLGIPGLYLAYRRTKKDATTPDSSTDQPGEPPTA